MHRYFRSVPTEPTSSQIAYEFIRERIISGEFEGGRKITTEDVATSIGLSRMPVREALRQLASEGLVTLLPNRGARVTMPSIEQVQELFEMRAALEGLAAATARENITAEHVEELKILVMRMERSRAEPKVWIYRHGEFHDFLCGLSNRPRLVGQINQLHAALQPCVTLYIANRSVSHMAGHGHLELADAIRTSRRPETAEKVAREHALHAARGVIDFLRHREAAPQSSLPRRPRPEKPRPDPGAAGALSARRMRRGVPAA